MASSLLSDQISTELKTTHKLTTSGANLFSWKIKLELLLIELSAQYVLKIPRPNPGSTQESMDAFNNWIYKDSLCRQIILDTIHLDLSPFLYNLPTAKSYMDFLQARFTTTPDQKIKLLKSYIHHAKMANHHIPISQQVSKIEKATFDVEMAGFTVPEEIKIHVLKNSLPASWKDTADGVIAGLNPKDFTFNILLERLRRVDEKRPVTYGDTKYNKRSWLICFIFFGIIVVLIGTLPAILRKK